MNDLTKDTKQFVDGIVQHLKKDKTGEKQSPKVKNLLRKVSQDALKQGVAKVTSATALTEEEKQALVRILSKRMNRPVTLECVVKPELIAGIRIEVADFIIDLSYGEELAAIGRMLVKGNRI